MTLRLVVRAAAEADVLEAALWCEQRSPGLGTEFLRAVDVVLAEIPRMPERYPLVRGDARRANLRRFPYAVVWAVDHAATTRVSKGNAEQAHQPGAPSRYTLLEGQPSQLMRGAFATPCALDTQRPDTYAFPYVSGGAR